jgi:uncharacterized protein (DUF433 family)
MPVETEIGSLISRTPGVQGGRPCVAGTRVRVQTIAVWSNQGSTPEEIAKKYGHLSLAQVHAALAYYHANKGEIDATLREDDRLYDELAAQHPPLKRL